MFAVAATAQAVKFIEAIDAKLPTAIEASEIPPIAAALAIIIALKPIHSQKL